MPAVVGTLLWGLVAGAWFASMRSAPHVPPMPASFFWYVACYVIVAMLVVACAVAALFGMADVAWTGGHPTLHDGLAAIRRRLLPIVTASLALFCTEAAAFVLAIPTLGISLLVFVLLAFYAVPSAALGGNGGFAAVREAWTVLRRAFWRSLLIVLLLVALQYVAVLPAYAASIALAAFAAVLGNAHGGASAPALVIAVPIGIALGVMFVLAMVAYQGFFALVVTGTYRSATAASDAARPA